jgi:hypothetical protein
MTVLAVYQPVHVLVVGVGILVLVLVTGQVLGLRRRNRLAERARRARRRPVIRLDPDDGDGEPWAPRLAVYGGHA